MARQKKRGAKTRQRMEAMERKRSMPTVVGLVGLAVFGLGTLLAIVGKGSALAALGACVGLAGSLTYVVARFVRDRKPRAKGLAIARSWWSFPVGVMLLIGGAGMLLYPVFLTPETFRQLAEQSPYGPLVAVAFLFAGAAFLIDGLDRPAPSEPPFAVPEPEGTLNRLRLVNPVQIPMALVALFVPRLWAKIPFAMYLYESWRELDAEAARDREARAEAGKTGYDWRPIVVFCLGAVLLGLMEYYGHAAALRLLVDFFDPPGRDGPPDGFFGIVRDGTVRGAPFERLIEFVWWSGWRLLGFFLLPALILKLLGERIADHGLQTRGFLSHGYIYVLFFAWVLFVVVSVSYEDSFQTYYPFYKNATRSWYDFWTWEVLYAVQFFSLEFFFRGFWLKSGKAAMGSHVIYAMAVPYCMIHFGKPFPETIAAIFAGVTLGTLALRTRSIWAGFLIHVSVAISMDVAALLQTTGLPTQWWPDL